MKNFFLQIQNTEKENEGKVLRKPLNFPMALDEKLLNTAETNV